MATTDEGALIEGLKADDNAAFLGEEVAASAANTPEKKRRPGLSKRRRKRKMRGPRDVVGAAVFTLACAAVIIFFGLPLLWLVTAPFDAHPTMRISWPDWSLENFAVLMQNPYALRSIGNSLIIGAGAILGVVVFGALASYALSRVRIPGRDGILYGMMLLSSIVTGTAAIIPTYQLIRMMGLMNTQFAVIIVTIGGSLPTAIFILKDFMDSIPKSYEESARLYGAKPGRILLEIVAPVARPGLAFIAVWTLVGVWGTFLTPYILLRDPSLQPAGVMMFSFYTESGLPDLPLISAFSLIYSLPPILIYFLFSRKFGFRFHGGIKS